MTREIAGLLKDESFVVKRLYPEMVRSDLNLDGVFPQASEQVLTKASGIIAGTVLDCCGVLGVPQPGFKIIPDTVVDGDFVDLSAEWIGERGELAADIYAHRYLKTYKTGNFKEEMLRWIAVFEDGITIRNTRYFSRNQEALKKYLEGIKRDFSQNEELKFGFSANMDVEVRDGKFDFTLGYGLDYLREVMHEMRGKGIESINSGIELRRKTAHEMYHIREALIFTDRFFDSSH